jgi:hypothetical protein
MHARIASSASDLRSPHIKRGHSDDAERLALGGGLFAIEIKLATRSHSTAPACSLKISDGGQSDPRRPSDPRDQIELKPLS